MMAKEWHTMDKKEWGPGPWQGEPDKMQWADEATGLPCLIVRNKLGALCRYVGAPPGHPWHGVRYQDIDADVHGGLTFSDRCMTPKEGEGHGICHIPEPGEPHDVWWLGFDCAHHRDIVPGLLRYGHASWEDDYRDIGYVRLHCRDLAQQVAAASGASP